MSSAAFELIARKYPSHRDQMTELERYLSMRSLDAAIRPQQAADFIGLKPDFVESLLKELANADVLLIRQCWICPRCEELIEGEENGSGKRECDLCNQQYSEGQVELEDCYFLKMPIVRKIAFSMQRTDKTKMEYNPLKDVARQQWARITPWRTLREDEYTILVTTLHPGVRDQALSHLQRYGIARLRWQGDPPTTERLLSVENWIGPARTEQNDFKGKVKSLKPDYDIAPNTGDSAKALAPHVDGTQDEITPAVLAFQYDLSATWGAESTFLDTAAMLAELPGDELERIIVTLSRNDCARCTKTKTDKKTGAVWSKTYNGPLIRSEYGGNSVSIRVREDDLLTVIPECQGEFDALKSAIAEWSENNLLRYTPHEGDVVIFDNWRVLHGRAAIGGRHQRIHDRMWIDRLLPEHAGKYLLGIRQLSPALIDAVQRGNAG
jgi:alpha-ketoglutarate-dependent taurine dioxygenase